MSVTLDGITMPREGAPVLRAALNQHWRVLVRDLLTLATRRCDEPTQRLHAQVLGIAQELLKREPRLLVRALRHPTVTGVLSGSGSAGHQFVLEATPFPYTHGFKPITPVRLTDANGFFSVSLPGLLENTELRIAALEPLPGHPVFSHPELVPVAPVVTLHVGPATKPGFARLYGTIEPAPALALVSFEMFAPHHKLEYVGKLVINGRPGRLDRFSRLVRIRHAGLYRVGVRTPGGAQVSGYSRLLSIG